MWLGRRSLRRSLEGVSCRAQTINNSGGSNGRSHPSSGDGHEGTTHATPLLLRGRATLDLVAAAVDVILAHHRVDLRSDGGVEQPNRHQRGDLVVKEVLYRGWPRSLRHGAGFERGSRRQRRGFMVMFRIEFLKVKFGLKIVRVLSASAFL